MSHFKTVVSKILVLKGAVRELWVTYLVYCIDVVAYGLMSSTLVLWLSSDLGFNDANAGYMIAIWSSLLTLFSVMVGSLTDAIGIRRTFLVGYIVVIGARFFMMVSTAKWIAIGLGLIPMALGVALLTPVMNAAVKRYSTTAQRSMAFSMYYTLMNVAYAIAGWLFDYVRGRLGEYGRWVMPGLHLELSSYRVLYFLAVVVSLLGFAITWLWLRDGVEATDQGVVIRPRERLMGTGHPIHRALGAVKTTLKKTTDIFSALWKQPNFYKFLALLSLIVGVRLIFYHIHYTFPKYGIRELGEGAPIGRLWGVLNPVMIVVLTPIVGALTQRISAWRMIIVGSMISALSMFILAIPPQMFQGLAEGWFGHLIAHTWLGISSPTVSPLYVSITICFFFLSIGEALWSPRLYEYTAAIAPKDQEASYMALSLLPYFIAKFFVGMFSGLMLEKYCPATGVRHSEMIWFWVALMALITPVGMLFLRKYIRVHEAGRDDND